MPPGVLNMAHTPEGSDDPKHNDGRTSNQNQARRVGGARHSGAQHPLAMSKQRSKKTNRRSYTMSIDQSPIAPRNATYGLTKQHAKDCLAEIENISPEHSHESPCLLLDTPTTSPLKEDATSPHPFENSPKAATKQQLQVLPEEDGEESKEEDENNNHYPKNLPFNIKSTDTLNEKGGSITPELEEDASVSESPSPTHMDDAAKIAKEIEKLDSGIIKK